jgi:excisionase family DNA binding protein
MVLQSMQAVLATGDVKMPKLPDRLLFPFEVARYFGVTEQTIYCWIKKKKIDHKHTPGGRIRIPKEAVERFEQENCS